MLKLVIIEWFCHLTYSNNYLNILKFCLHVFNTYANGKETNMFGCLGEMQLCLLDIKHIGLVF